MKYPLVITVSLLSSLMCSQGALTTDLYAYYTFDSNYANDSAASGGAAEDAVSVNGPGVSAGASGGLVGNAALFTTGTGYLKTSTSFGSGSDLNTSFTISAWYNIADNSPSVQASNRFMIYEGNTQYDMSFGLRDVVGADSDVADDGQAYTGEGDTTKFVNFLGAGVQGSWNHVIQTVTLNDANVDIMTYVNGAAGVKLSMSSAAFGDSGFNLGYARDSKTGREFNGLIDEVAIWSRTLDDTEVATVYAQGSAGVSVTAVPEPSSSALLGLAALSLVLRRRR